MTVPRAVVVDLDDTLFPEREYVRSGFAALDDEVCRAFGVTGFGAVAWELFESGVRGRIIDAALGRLGLAADAAMVTSLVDCYRAHQPSIGLYPDVAPALRSVCARARAAIISDGPLAAQQRKVEALGLQAWFDPILLTDRWGRDFWKPHERAFREIEALTAAGGAACAYLGDNPHKDFVAPGRLGWRTVRVRRPDGEHASVAGNGGAQVECASLADAVRWLGFEVEECGDDDSDV